MNQSKKELKVALHSLIYLIKLDCHRFLYLFHFFPIWIFNSGASSLSTCPSLRGCQLFELYWLRPKDKRTSLCISFANLVTSLSDPASDISSTSLPSLRATTRPFARCGLEMREGAMTGSLNEWSPKLLKQSTLEYIPYRANRVPARTARRFISLGSQAF